MGQQSRPPGRTRCTCIDNGYPAGASGLYDVHLDLNALIKPDQSVDTPGGALNIDPSSYALGAGAPSAMPSSGTCPSHREPSSATRWWSSTATMATCILVTQANGAIIDTFYSPDFSNLYLFDVAIAPDNTFYVMGDENFYTGVIVHMDLSGNTLGEITVPVTDSSGYLSPEGFGLDPSDGVFWIAADQQRADRSYRLERQLARLTTPLLARSQRRSGRARRAGLLHQHFRCVGRHARSEHRQRQLLHLLPVPGQPDLERGRRPVGG